MWMLQVSRVLNIITSWRLILRKRHKIISLHHTYLIMIHGIIYYIHMKELRLCFCFLCFVGFIVKCVYDTIILCRYYICIMTRSISYRFSFDICINRMHNIWMNEFTCYGAPVSLANRQMMTTMINNCANREVTINFIGY
jgi:hypothetical protein